MATKRDRSRSLSGRRTRTALAGIAVLTLILTACSGGEEPAAATGDGAAPGNAADTGGAGGGDEWQTAVIGLPMDHLGLDAAWYGTGVTGPCLPHIFAPFTERGFPHLTSGDLLPGVVEEFVMHDDRLTWTLNLRDDVTFHNGDHMTAEDVAFSINLWLTPEWEGTVSQSYFETVDEAVVVDDYTVEVRFTEIDELFHSNSPRAYVIPKDYYEEVGREGFNAHPIAAGPYKFAEWQPGNFLRMEAFDDFYGGRAEIDEVVCRVLPDDASRVAALQAGEIDIAAPLPIEQIETVDAAEDLKVVTSPSLNRTFIMMDTTFEPWDDRLVRLAVNHAIDKELIVEQVLDGMAEVIPAGLVPELEPGWNPDLEPYPYDPDRARELLAEAGYPNGLGEEFGTLGFACRGDLPKAEETCTILAEMLGAVGIPVQIQMMEVGAYETASEEKTLPPLAYMAHSGGGNFMGAHHLRSTKVCSERSGEVTTPLSPSSTWGGYYCNPEVDALVYEAHEKWGSDYERAIEAVEEAEALVHEDAASGFLWAFIDPYGVREGLEFTPPGRLDFNLYGARWEQWPPPGKQDVG